MKIPTNVGRTLGELEKDIMDVMWQKGQLSIRDVVSLLSVKRKIAYTTVLTVMNRLVQKGLLTRRLHKTAYFYKPKIDKDSFIASVAHQIVKTTVATLGEEVVTYFVREIERLSPEKRRELLSILNQDVDEK